MTAGGLTQGESMTPHTGFNLFGKIEGIYQNVKITPLKNITADEVEFFASEEKFDMYSEFRRFMKDKNILKEGKNLNFSENFCNKLLWQGSSEKTADALFNALADFSVAKKINFLLNYHCAEEEEINAEKKIVLTFHPEVIINGKRLINDFPDVDLNRRFILLEECKVQDITYLDCGVKSEPVLFGEACRQVCEKTFASLDKYFNVDYNVSLVFGTAKREYTGLAPEVKKSIMEKF